jgi:ribosomal protein L14E/L6E/L27E
MDYEDTIKAAKAGDVKTVFPLPRSTRAAKAAEKDEKAPKSDTPAKRVTAKDLLSKKKHAAAQRFARMKAAKAAAKEAAA